LATSANSSRPIGTPLGFRSREKDGGSAALLPRRARSCRTAGTQKDLLDLPGTGEFRLGGGQGVILLAQVGQVGGGEELSELSRRRRPLMGAAAAVGLGTGAVTLAPIGTSP
jgi:hypothetical protein